MDSKNIIFSNPPKCQELVLGLKKLIDAKSMDVAQPLWLSCCPEKGLSSAEEH